MPKQAKELAAYQVKRLTKPGFHSVGGVAGLHLRIKPSGAKNWIIRATVGEKRQDIGLGGFPTVSLEDARREARKVRVQIRDGIDPTEAKRAAKAALKAADAKRLTFSEAAVQCHAARAHEFRSEKHKNDWLNSLTTHASPIIGNLSVSAIEVAHVIRVLEPIWATKTETATRVRQRIEKVLNWAAVSGYRSGENPAAWKGRLEHTLAKPSKLKKVTHFAALPWQEIGQFMADLRNREGVSARALEFLILTAARSGDVRKATWDEIDLDAQLWTIPGERMKQGKEHKVPLSGPSRKILRALPIIEGSEYVFTAPRGGALSDMSISAVCRRMGIGAVPHGFRSTFKDWCRSSTSYADEVSELSLAHVNSDATRAAYARDELLPKRKQLMDQWAKYCGTVAKKGKVAHIGSKR